MMQCVHIIMWPSLHKQPIHHIFLFWEKELWSLTQLIDYSHQIFSIASADLDLHKNNVRWHLYGFIFPPI